MPRADLPYWVALIHYPKFGPRTMARLFLRFGDMKCVWGASLADLVAAEIRPDVAEGFIALRDGIDPLAIMRELELHHVRAITVEDDDYPPLLKTIYDPPSVLFIRGTLPSPERTHVAIVGSRHATAYGLEVARNLSLDLARAGAVIVSGLAFGIDEAAHMATLDVQGTTVAVLASGLLNIGTSRQRLLADEIMKSGGAVISEFAPHMISFKTHFPIRNRIISGLSQGTLVIEAAIKSGSLITARAAAEQGREVFAVPGPITSPTSEGCNELLRSGAHIAICAADVMEPLGVESVRELAQSIATPTRIAESPQEAAVLGTLSRTPIHHDEIIRAAKLEASVIAQTLTFLELKGWIRREPGNYYILC